MKSSHEAMDLREREIKRALDEAKRALDSAMKHWQKDLEKAQQESKQPRD